MAFKTTRMTEAERDLMNREFQDRAYPDLPLKSAEIEIAIALGYDTATGFATRDGKTRSFPIEIHGSDRIAQFHEGLGKHIQSIWEARCDESFARRDAGLPDDGTPDARDAACKLVVLGAFEKRGGQHVFHLARWAWKNAAGEIVEGGWNPVRKGASLAGDEKLDTRSLEDAPTPH